MSNLSIFQLSADMAQIEHLLEENGGELTPEIEQAWAETSESLAVKVDSYNALIKKMEAYSTNIDTEIKRLQALKKTSDNSVKVIKHHLLSAMECYGLERIDGELCKVSLAKAPVSTEIDEEEFLQPYQGKIAAVVADLPDFITLVPKISATKVKEAFYGKDVTPAGVTFVDDKKSLRIR